MECQFLSRLVHDSAFVAENAILRGEVHVGAQSSIWYGAVVRGDVVPVHIGRDTNLQDLVCVHGDPGFACTIGDRVTVGHGAIVHGATVENDVLIGIRAVVLNGARIGNNALIGAGALVCEGQVIPPRSLVLGVPGKIVRQVTDEELQRIRHGAEHYVAAAKSYRSQQS